MVVHILITIALIIGALVCGFHIGRAYDMAYWFKQFEDMEKRIDLITNIRRYNND